MDRPTFAARRNCKILLYYVIVVNIVSSLPLAVLTEGFPVPNSTCDRVFPGRTGPRTGSVSGSSRSLLRRPDLRASVEMAAEEDGAVTCSSALVPSESQSVTVVVSAMSKARRGVILF